MNYREHQALNFSLAKHLLRSPAHFRAAQAAQEPETKAMLLGTILHGMVLEDKPISDFAAVRPDGLNLTTKAGKAWKESNPGPEITHDEWCDLLEMKMAIERHDCAIEALHACREREVELYATMRGAECKAKPDAIGTGWDGAPLILDLKTTDNASPEAFRKTIIQRNYEMQASWYCDLAAIALGWENEPRFAWIAVEKSPPYAVAVYECGSDFMAAGRAMCQKAIETYRECQEIGEWPGPADGWNVINPPAWYAYRNERGEG